MFTGGQDPVQCLERFQPLRRPRPQVPRCGGSVHTSGELIQDAEAECVPPSNVRPMASRSHPCRHVVREAGQAFEKAAAIQTKNLNEPDDAANTMVDAFKAYRTIDAEAASRCLDIAVQRYCVKGNFRRAATHKESLGDLYETELGDNKKAMECYEAAAGWYEGDNALACVESPAPLTGFSTLGYLLGLQPREQALAQGCRPRGP